MESLKIAVVQFCIEEMNIAKNAAVAFGYIRQAAGQQADLVILPELWPLCVVSDPGALQRESIKKDIAELQKKLVELAMTLRVKIIGGMPLWENSEVFNSLCLITPEGSVEAYRKMHLFTPMGEDRFFSPGRQTQVFWIDGIKGCESGVGVGAAICFDLRFPALFKSLAQKGAKLMAVSALWPKQRIAHFNVLSQARAVENQCFLVAANAVGSCGGHVFGGSSRIISPSGEILCDAGTNEGFFVAAVDMEEVLRVRNIFNTVSDSPVLLSSESEAMSYDKLLTVVRRRKAAGQRMAFTNGCFDILHAGHVRYLEQARQLGDFLVVGLNSDFSVKRLKGEDRPVNPEVERATVLLGLKSVDYVTIFNDDTPASLISLLEPDVLVKGADWEESRIVGADIVKAKGGKVVRIPFQYETSTSRILKKLL